MVREGGVRTVPSKEKPGWWNVVDGKVVSRHRKQEDAVEAGREIARKLRVEHSIDDADDGVVEENSNGNDSFPTRG